MSVEDQKDKGATATQDSAAGAGREKEPAPSSAEADSQPREVSRGEGGESGESAVSKAAGETRELAMLMDVELSINAELGRARMTIGEIMKLSTGSIVRLNKAAGDPVDLRINDKLFASGEVIVVDDHFAIKITKLLSKEERVKSFS